ncbi:hypothetical protein PIB30_059172 [Stylosanthes scabra]|uniref:Uncharacterized protein n=1 Tax=Stylosanthes scabra TaxID=79078 RepID=A0ABU6SL02_9FABA|nr:hypothetical protein [Stylosanthes scabra]
MPAAPNLAELRERSEKEKEVHVWAKPSTPLQSPPSQQTTPVVSLSSTNAAGKEAEACAWYLGLDLAQKWGFLYLGQEQMDSHGHHRGCKAGKWASKTLEIGSPKQKLEAWSYDYPEPTKRIVLGEAKTTNHQTLKILKYCVKKRYQGCGPVIKSVR